MKALVLTICDVLPMQVECAWCKRVLSPGREPVSHGICPECAKTAFSALDSNTQPEAQAV